jgi:hypothetical protein
VDGPCGRQDLVQGAKHRLGDPLGPDHVAKPAHLRHPSDQIDGIIDPGRAASAALRQPAHVRRQAAQQPAPLAGLQAASKALQDRVHRRGSMIGTNPCSRRHRQQVPEGRSGWPPRHAVL